jgi:hypothetical protein
MNHIHKDFLEFVYSTLGHWQKNFETMPIVYIGIGRPMYKLNKNQRFIAQLGVIFSKVVLEYFLDRDDQLYRKKIYMR